MNAGSGRHASPGTAQSEGSHSHEHTLIAMSGTGYKILGYVVWRGGKWYLRRLLPPVPLMAFGAIAAVGAVATVVGGLLIRRRVAGGRSRGAT